MLARISVQQFIYLLYSGADIFLPSVKYICHRQLEEIMPNWKCTDRPLGFSYYV